MFLYLPGLMDWFHVLVPAFSSDGSRGLRDFLVPLLVALYAIWSLWGAVHQVAPERVSDTSGDSRTDCLGRVERVSGRPNTRLGRHGRRQAVDGQGRAVPT